MGKTLTQFVNSIDTSGMKIGQIVKVRDGITGDILTLIYKRSEFTGNRLKAADDITALAALLNTASKYSIMTEQEGEKTYYLISCEDREETNIGVIADRRNLREDLQEILQRNFDDEDIRILDIVKKGKDYEKRFKVFCKDGEGYKFNVQLEQTILFY